MSANDNIGPNADNYDPEMAKILGLNYKLAILETGIDSLLYKLELVQKNLKEIIELSKQVGHGEKG